MNPRDLNIPQNGHGSADPDNDDVLESIDLDKILRVFKGSIPHLIVIILAINSLSYLYLRYTKPIYESESILKLDIKSEASILGLQNPLSQDIKGISGEIELLKSRLFLGQVVDVIGMDVSYYHPGRSHLVDERFRNSPFEVSHKLKNSRHYDTRFNLEIIDDDAFELSYTDGFQTITGDYTFGEPIETKDFNFLIEKTAYFNNSKGLTDYYFVVNSRDALINYLVANVMVQPVNFNSNTIRISLRDNNAFKARSLIEAIDTLYLDFTKETKNLAAEQKIAFLESQMEKTSKELESYEEYFEKFTIENRTTDLSNDINRTIQILNTLDSQRVRLRNQLTEIELIALQIQSGQILNISPFAIEGMPNLIQSSINKYNELLTERELKLASYKENTLVIRRLDQKIASVMKSASESISEYQRILVKDVEELKNRMDQLERNFIALPSMGTAYNKNRRFYTLQEEFYFSLIKSKIELEIAQAGTVPNFVILSPATLPSEPVHPKGLIIYGAGFVGSIFLSFLFLAIRYLLHNKISSQKELEKLINAPILGIVPYYKEHKPDQASLIVSNNPKSAISESLRSIRTNLEFIAIGKEKKVISITSTVSGEGKTFIAVNLGAILAYSKLKVVIVDLDMRKPKVHLAFDQEKGTKGVSTILIDKHTVKECVHDTELENLHFITSGPTPPNPSELILSEKFDHFIEELKREFDVIFLDTPPVGLVTDGILAMKRANLPIYVVRADYSKKSYIKSVHSLISNHRFKNLSVIFNSVKFSKSHGYGYGYGYYDDSEQQAKGKSVFSKIFSKS